MATLNGTVVNFSLEQQKDTDREGNEYSWYNLNLEIYPHCDGTHTTKTQFWTIGSMEIDNLIDDLKKIRNQLIYVEESKVK